MNNMLLLHYQYLHWKLTTNYKKKGGEEILLQLLWMLLSSRYSMAKIATVETSGVPSTFQNVLGVCGAQQTGAPTSMHKFY